MYSSNVHNRAKYVTMLAKVIIILKQISTILCINDENDVNLD